MCPLQEGQGLYDSPVITLLWFTILAIISAPDLPFLWHHLSIEC